MSVSLCVSIHVSLQRRRKAVLIITYNCLEIRYTRHKATALLFLTILKDKFAFIFAQ